MWCCLLLFVGDLLPCLPPCRSLCGVIKQGCFFPSQNQHSQQHTKKREQKKKGGGGRRRARTRLPPLARRPLSCRAPHARQTAMMRHADAPNSCKRCERRGTSFVSAPRAGGLLGSWARAHVCVMWCGVVSRCPHALPLPQTFRGWGQSG